MDADATRRQQELFSLLKHQAWAIGMTANLLDTYCEMGDAHGAAYAIRNIAAYSRYTSEIMALLATAVAATSEVVP